MSDQPRLVEFESSHLPGLLRLWAKYFGSWSAQRLEERWSWQFQSNPFATSRPPRIILAFVGDEPVGHIGGVPLPIRIASTVHIGLAATGLVAESSHRWLGFRLVRSLLETPPILASGMAEGAEKLFTQCGARLLPGSGDQFFFPRRYEGELAGKLRWRLPRGLANLISPRVIGLAAPWYRPSGQPRPRPMPRPSNITPTKPIDRFGPSYDQLWHAASPHVRFTVEKSAAFMNWRYVDCPTQHAIRLATFSPEGRMTGVCVGVVRVRLDRFGNPCARIGEIVELLSSPQDRNVLPTLLIAAMHALDQFRVDAFVSTILNPDVRTSFVETGFTFRDEGEFSAAAALGTLGNLGELNDPGMIWYGAGDGDSLLAIVI